MSRQKNDQRSGMRHIWLALATGTCIVLMAWMSKRVLPTPLSTLEMALPPFLAALGEGFWSHPKFGGKLKTGYGIALVLAAPGLMIARHIR